MIRLKMICDAFPEAYEAFDGDKLVGYLVTRWGSFSVYCPDRDGDCVYTSNIIEGFGNFDDDERDYHLRFAVDAIEKWVKGEFIAKPPAPDVQYEVINDLDTNDRNVF